VSNEPNVIPFGRHQALDPETNIIIGRAFDAAWLTLRAAKGECGSDEMRETLARRIIELAQRGERDVAALRDEALKHLGPLPGSDRHAGQAGRDTGTI
jgi:hypothetical protein